MSRENIEKGQPPEPLEEITELLCAWSGGEPHIQNRLFNAVYPELRRLAASKIRSEGSAISIQATDLVHEAYLKLNDQKRAVWKNREQFFAIAAVLIRRILVDRARHRQRQKRGADAIHVVLDEAIRAGPEIEVDVLDLEQALRGLAAVSVTAERIVELRFFGGLSVTETAITLGLGRRTVVRKWRFAKTFLADRLRRTA